MPTFPPVPHAVAGRSPAARLADSVSSLVWLLPSVVVTLAVLLPPAYLGLRAVRAGRPLWEELFQVRTLEILFQTGLLAVTVTAAATLLAVPLAWLTVRTDLPFRRAWAVLTVLPLVIPSYVGALVVVAALGPRGLVQQWLEGPLGVERLPEIYGFPGAVLTLTLLSFPYVLLSVRSGLAGLDPALEEAARGLGDGPWRVFFRVVLPQLAPATAAGALLVALYTLSDFGAVSLLRFDSFTYLIYLDYKTSFDRHLAAGLALVLVLLTLGILWLEARARGRGRYYRSSAGAKRLAPRVRLGVWRWPAVAFCGAVVGLSLVVPLGVMSWWLARGLAQGESLAPLWEPARNSVTVSLMAAAVCLIAALPVAVLSVRYPGRWAAFVERTSYIGFALPGIVVALALVFFGVGTPLYQSLPLLLLAYGILFLPQAVGSSRAALLQVKPSLEEAARSLGRRPTGVLWSVTLPLLRPGLLAGAGLVFLTVMKELPATMILGPTGFRTLATRIWNATEASSFTHAAAPALALVIVAAVPMAVLLWSERGVRP